MVPTSVEADCKTIYLVFLARQLTTQLSTADQKGTEHGYTQFAAADAAFGRRSGWKHSRLRGPSTSSPELRLGVMRRQGDHGPGVATQRPDQTAPDRSAVPAWMRDGRGKQRHGRFQRCS